MTQMASEQLDFEKGDWIVHLYHGVGQVKGIVKKKVNGERVAYYRVKTDNSTLYVPVEDQHDERLRPAATKRQLDAAIKALNNPPKEMAKDHTDRRRRIREVKTDGTLESMVKLVRDLSWRRYDKKLNNTEERALRRFKDRLLQEWAVARQISTDDARKQLNTMLRSARPDAKEAQA
jgi:RNA polymerase-interacting CarD/CdnL/TRCF family regulator